MNKMNTKHTAYYQKNKRLWTFYIVEVDNLSVLHGEYKDVKPLIERFRLLRYGKGMSYAYSIPNDQVALLKRYLEYQTMYIKSIG
jgi:hypothetical protein